MDDYNSNKKSKNIDRIRCMIADMLSKKKLQPIVAELFIRGRKLNISLVFSTQNYFDGLKNFRLNSAYYFIMKIPNKLQCAINHLIRKCN